LDLVHALANADGRSEMINRVDAAERAMNGRMIAEVATQQFDIRIKIIRIAVAMDLADERIDNPDVVTAAQERIAKMRPDKPGAAGYQNLPAHEKNSVRKVTSVGFAMMALGLSDSLGRPARPDPHRRGERVLQFRTAEIGKG
jgi:hypothetical protein